MATRRPDFSDHDPHDATGRGLLPRVVVLVVVCLVALLPLVGGLPTGVSETTTVASAAEPDTPAPPPCPPGQSDSVLRRCVFTYDEAQLTVSPSVITLGAAYPSCVGGAWASLPTTGRCEVLDLSLSIPSGLPYCGDIEGPTDCYVVQWGGTQKDIWYDTWTTAGVFRYLSMGPDLSCSGAALSCNRHFLIGSESEGLGGTGWLILSDPRVEFRDYGDSPATYDSTYYTPEFAVYVPAEEEQGPSASFNYVVDSDKSGVVRFTSTSTDPNDRLLSAQWDYGDGSTGIGTTASHNYLESGTYEVTLTVSNIDGGSDSVTRSVTVEVADPPPPLVVNSVGDAPAEDAAEGCDTGATVGDEPECTLRAAIQTVNASGPGGTTITFAIAGSGLPTIATATALPQVTRANAKIDGTTQPGGFVKVTAGGRSETVLDVTGEKVSIGGMVLDEADRGIRAAGAGVVVEGNAIGAMPTGTTAGSIEVGVQIEGDDVTVRDNVVGTEGGAVVRGSKAVIEANYFGVSRAGGVIDGTDVGVFVLGPQAEVTGNTIRSAIVGVEVATGIPTVTGSGSSVSGNFIGVTSSGVALAGQGEGVRVDGAKDVTVSGNRIDPHIANGSGVSVTGRTQIYAEGEGEDVSTVFHYYTSGEPISNDITGGKVTVSGNVIGDVARGASAVGSRPRNGVIVWADAAGVTVTGNTIAGQSGAGIELHGGAGHVLEGNTVGSSSGDGAGVSGVGISADETPGLILGRRGAGNTVLATTRGIAVTGEGTTGAVTGNTVTASGIEEDTAGISVPEGTGTVTVEANTVTGFTVGIGVATPSPRVVANVVADSGTGIIASTDSATLSTNIVTGTATAAIVAAGGDATVEENLVGRTSANGADIGNGGEGIVVQKGDAKVTRNVVAGSVGNGISVAADAKAELRGNEIAATTGSPILAPGGPAAPVVAAAIRTTYDGATRTALVITGLPAESGTIEVFANDSCVDGEAEKVLEVTKSKTTGLTSKAILLKDRLDDDAFTVTFTTGGSTSELSGCTPIGDYPDSDGDGSPDPFDALWDGEADPTKAVFVTDDEQLLGLTVAGVDPETGLGGGRLSGAGPVDTPPERPADVSLPYGLIGFTIEDLEPGGTTAVYLTVLDGEGPRADDAYWKYGPETPGAASSWYDFSFDEETGIGGSSVDPVDVAGFGIRRPFAVILRDGALGDDDGGMNGSIHDPGGIARILTGFPTDPTPTTEPPTTQAPTTGVPVVGGSPVTIPGPAAAAAVAVEGTLPYTGSDDGYPLVLGAVLVSTGAVAVGATRRRRRA